MKKIWVPMLAIVVTMTTCCAGKIATIPGEPDATEAVRVPPMPGPGEWKGDTSPDWNEIDRLVGDQQYQAALDRMAEMEKVALSKRDAREQVRIIIRRMSCEVSLDRWQEGLSNLIASRGNWPGDLVSQTTLGLYLAETVLRYKSFYSWEISRRPERSDVDMKDIKTWSARQITDLAVSTLFTLWTWRDALAEIPTDIASEFLEKDTYPADVRGTLADGVAYRLAEALADSGTWSVAQTGDVWKIRIDDLLGPATRSSLKEYPVETHPLIVMAEILRDHEALKAVTGKPQGALEARLQLIRLLDGHASDRKEWTAQMIASLTTRLRAETDHDWWSMGMAMLAMMVRTQEAPDSMVRAMAITRECIAARPGTNGADQCADIANEITARQIWNFHGMAASGLNSKSLSVETRNVDHLWFRAWKVDYSTMVNNLDLRTPDDEVAARYREREKLPKPDLTWDEKLDFPIDYQARRHTFATPISKKGAWVVQVSANREFTKEDNVIASLLMFVGGPVVSVEAAWNSPRAQFKVLTGENGDPVADAGIRVFRVNWNRHEKPRTLLQSARTDEHGDAEVTRDNIRSGRVLAFVDHGGMTWPVNLPYFYYDRYDGYDEDDGPRGVVLTDRAIYRPGQKAFFKLMAVRRAPAKSDLPWIADDGHEMEIELLDANWDVVSSLKVRTNAWGTASGEFAIPEGRMLGNWTIRAAGVMQSSIKVEEYRIPSFTVEIDNPEGLRLNVQAEVAGGADYFFGLPVSGANIKWRVERQPIWPWWWDGGSTQSRVIASGTGMTDEKGRFKVGFLAEAEASQDAGKPAPDYWFNLNVDITDDAGETHSAARSFRLGYSTVKADATAERKFFDAGDKVEIKVSRTDINGNPAPGDVNWTLMKIEPPDRTPLPSSTNANKRAAGLVVHERDGGQGYDPAAMIRAWKDGNAVSNGKLTTAGNGTGNLDLDAVEPGFWRVRYSVVDPHGSRFDGSFDFNVVSPSRKTALPMLMVASKPKYEVGETIRLAVSSGFDGQYAMLQVRDRGGQTEVRHLRLGVGTSILEYKVTRAMRGGVAFRLLAYRDYESLMLSETVSVPWTDRLVDVAIESVRDRVTPGGRETVSVRVMEHGGKKGIPAVEVLSWMYDRSLDDIAKGYFPDLSGIWPGLPWSSERIHNLGSARQIWFDADGFERDVVGYESYEPMNLKYLERLQLFGGRMTRDGARARTSMGYGSLGGTGAGGGGLMLQASAVADEEMAEGSAMAKSKSMEMPASAPMKSDKLPGAGSLPRAEPPAAQPRSNFAETAFFMPHLISNADGSVTFEYEVPDSVTTWKLLARALTKDLRSGSAEVEIISAKDLMVKPFLPRFLREGDSSTVTAVVANTTDKPMSGVVTVSITDPTTGTNLERDFSLLKNTARFTCAPGSETTVSFQILAPSRPGPSAFKVMATSGNLSDGELRNVPVLPGRYHLMQSRFVTLHGKNGVDERTMEFPDMGVVDATRINEQLVVTVDGQLFMSVLKALPYLTEYPYECAEQTLNRFVSTGILTGLFTKYPGIAAMAKKAADRETQFQPWNDKDPNRKLSLEETPWLQEATGEGSEHVLKILDPKVAEHNRRTALARLKKMQHADGAFPWFPGGPPSSWMTMYIVAGFSRAMEFGVDVPADMLSGAVQWTHNWYLEMKNRHRTWIEDDWYTATYLAWILWNLPTEVRSIFTEEEQRHLLELSFDNWKKMSMGLKSMLAMTLHRAGRAADAKLVWTSVMDSARTEPDRGMFWAQEERSWLWYNDSIENHARAIRTLEELDPTNKSIDDLVLWLFINKKLNHWKSTRATAEVVYALARHLDARGEIGGREVIAVRAGSMEREFTFDPATSTGTSAQLIIDGPDVDNATMSKVVVSKQTPGWAMASATWHFSTEKLPEEGSGDLLRIDRSYFLKKKTSQGTMLEPLTDGLVLLPGDEVEVQVSIKSGEPMEYVHLRDPRPAGFEPATQNSGYRWDLGIYWYEEVRDSGENFFFERLPRGQYTFRYTIRAALAGTFKAAPATIQPMYAPEFAAYSSGRLVKIDAR